LRWTWPDDLRLVVATPAIGLATAKARAALPRELPRADAIFNLQRVLSLVHALQHREYDRLKEAVKDRLHQPARAALVPLLREALGIEDPRVLGAFLSGAGPSVALLARHENAGHVERLLASMYEGAGVEATVRTLGAYEGAPSNAQGPRLTAQGMPLNALGSEPWAM
jgi:homoserine kinase